VSADDGKPEDTGKYIALYAGEAAIVLRVGGVLEVVAHSDDSDAAKAARMIASRLVPTEQGGSDG
jgi:hypothetical protein